MFGLRRKLRALEEEGRELEEIVYSLTRAEESVRIEVDPAQVRIAIRDEVLSRRLKKVIASVFGFEGSARAVDEVVASLLGKKIRSGRELVSPLGSYARAIDGAHEFRLSRGLAHFVQHAIPLIKPARRFLDGFVRFYEYEEWVRKLRRGAGRKLGRLAPTMLVAGDIAWWGCASLPGPDVVRAVRIVGGALNFLARFGLHTEKIVVVAPSRLLAEDLARELSSIVGKSGPTSFAALSVTEVALAFLGGEAGAHPRPSAMGGGGARLLRELWRELGRQFSVSELLRSGLVVSMDEEVRAELRMVVENTVRRIPEPKVLDIVQEVEPSRGGLNVLVVAPLERIPRGLLHALATVFRDHVRIGLYETPLIDAGPSGFVLPTTRAGRGRGVEDGLRVAHFGTPELARWGGSARALLSTLGRCLAPSLWIVEENGDVRVDADALLERIREKERVIEEIVALLRSGSEKSARRVEVGGSREARWLFERICERVCRTYGVGLTYFRNLKQALGVEW